MKPLGKNEHFNLVLPWSDETVDLGPRIIEEGKLIYEPLEGRAGGFALNESRGKGIKIYDGDVFIKLGNVTISMNGAPFSWQNQASKMQDLLAGFSSEDSNFKVKTMSLANRIVYEIRLNNSDIDFSQFFILVKNRLWAIVVSDIGSNHPNREPLVKKDTYMAIVERLIATIPDNPPNIETTFINQQTKRQLKLPDGWGVLQEFKHGEPLSQIGVYQYGKIDEANYILYDCSPLFLGGLIWDPDFNYSERITFEGRDAVKQAHQEFIVSARDENGAC